MGGWHPACSNLLGGGPAGRPRRLAKEDALNRWHFAAPLALLCLQLPTAGAAVAGDLVLLSPRSAWGEVRAELVSDGVVTPLTGAAPLADGDVALLVEADGPSSFEARLEVRDAAGALIALHSASIASPDDSLVVQLTWWDGSGLTDDVLWSLHEASGAELRAWLDALHEASGAELTVTATNTDTLVTTAAEPLETITAAFVDPLDGEVPLGTFTLPAATGVALRRDRAGRSVGLEIGGAPTSAAPAHPASDLVLGSARPGEPSWRASVSSPF